MNKIELRARCGRILRNLTHDDNAAANGGDDLADLFDELAGGRIEPGPLAPPVAYDPDADFERVHVVPPKTRGREVAELSAAPRPRTPGERTADDFVRVRQEADGGFSVSLHPGGGSCGGPTIRLGDSVPSPFAQEAAREIRRHIAAAIDREREAAAAEAVAHANRMWQVAFRRQAPDGFSPANPGQMAQAVHAVREAAAKAERGACAALMESAAFPHDCYGDRPGIFADAAAAIRARDTK